MIHERWIDTYGWFDEGQDAYETERLMNDRFIALPGPDVVLALPHPWLHVGDDAEMAGIVPDGVTA